MVFKDVIDNFIAPICLDQPDGWDYILVRLSVLEGTGLEYIEYDSIAYQFEDEIFNTLNYLEGWPSGRYDNYTIIPNRLNLRPRDKYGRYIVECTLVSPWVTKESALFTECLDEIRVKDISLYSDVKRAIDNENTSFS